MAGGPYIDLEPTDGSAGRPTGREPKRSRPVNRYQQPGSVTGLVVKLTILALLNGLVLNAVVNLRSLDQFGEIDAEWADWPYLTFSLVSLLAIDIVYLSKRMIPAKYLLPGTIFLLAFAVYPVFYTFYISFTNYGTGNLLSKAAAIERIESNSISATEDATRFELQVLAEGDIAGPIAFLLTDAEGNSYLGTADGLEPLTPDQLVEQGRRVTVDGYVALNAGQANDRKLDIAALQVPSDVGPISTEGFSEAFAKVQLLVYDPETNTVVNTQTGTVYSEADGRFVSDDGEALSPGWRAFIGTENYQRINDERIRGPFIRVFIWTFVFAAGSVLITFGLGLLLALVFSNERMRGRSVYRLIMVVPYALPSFMTALVWRGMLNQQFGIVNRMFGVDLPWLDGQWLPYVSILLVNLWLGFPYMFLISTGALQSIPSDLKEASYVDGATGLQAFRKVTLPLLLISVAPLLIASFAYNFNNFNIIYLLTEGRPPIQGSTAGRTDILISYTYKLAFAGGRGVDLAFASAISVIIFLIVASISAFSFRYTKAFEEIE